MRRAGRSARRRARSPLPERLPITLGRPPLGRAGPGGAEPEITRPGDLCDARGRLDPAAVGWSRRPLTRANLSGHWPRKKRWNFWNWIAPDFVLSVTLADIDYASLCAFFFLDFDSGDELEGLSLGLPGRFALPEHVDATLRFRGGGIEYENRSLPDGHAVRFAARGRDGRELEADFRVQRPAGHESLNIVVPWTRTRFQLNSKHNTLPCRGQVIAAGRRYAMEPERCHAVQDFGRGLWPYRAFWNWGVATGVQQGELVGVNMGGRWTTGTGINENGIFLGGRLFKLSEELAWSYDPAEPSAPWRVRTPDSDALDLVLRPRALHGSKLNLGLLASGGFCAFGEWSGRLHAGDRRLAVDGLVGWAEEFSHRW